VGAVLLNPRYIVPGSVNTTGEYKHFSALRSYEDLLGLTRGGDDGLGHLGFAAEPGLAPFGRDVFNAARDEPERQEGASGPGAPAPGFAVRYEAAVGATARYRSDPGMPTGLA
jgi:hypothetical protein